MQSPYMQTKPIASLFPLTGGCCFLSRRSPENRNYSGNIYVLICLGSHKTESHQPSVSSHAPPKLWVTLSTPQKKRFFKKSIKINLIYICLFLKALLEATQFKCFALSYFLSSDCKTTVSLMQIFNLSDPRWDGSPSDSFIFHCSQTNMAASEDLSERERERERERGGLAHTSPLLIYLRTSEGAMSGFIHQIYNRSGETMYVLLTGISNLCCVYSNAVINLYSPHIQPPLNSTFEDSFSLPLGQEWNSKSAVVRLPMFKNKLPF